MSHNIHQILYGIDDQIVSVQDQIQAAQDEITRLQGVIPNLQEELTLLQGLKDTASTLSEGTSVNLTVNNYSSGSHSVQHSPNI